MNDERTKAILERVYRAYEDASDPEAVMHNDLRYLLARLAHLDSPETQEAIRWAYETARCDAEYERTNNVRSLWYETHAAALRGLLLPEPLNE